MKSFKSEGILWTPISIVTESSDQGVFQWEKVTAMWSGFGPNPYVKEKIFLTNRRRVKDFKGNPITPIYI